MATYSIAANKRSTDALTLSANVTDTITITAREAAIYPMVVVHPGSTSATTPVWVTFDGSDPDPTQGFASPLWPGQSGALDDRVPVARPAANFTVKVRSAAAQVYSVET